MSFQDLEAGRPLTGRVNGRPDPTQAVAAGLFQINTAVATFKRLVNTLGTPKDSPALRDKLRKTRLHITQLVKDTSAKLKQASETDHRLEVSATKKIADAKLAKDFEAVLQDFQKAQHLAVERETSYAPFVPQAVRSSHTANEVDIISDKTQEQRAMLLDSKRQEILLLDNEVVFNEAIIEEREQGIQEIQQQIGEVNEIFKDLAVLVHDQGAMIDDIDSNIESSLAATALAKTQLAKAAKTQKSNSSLLDMHLHNLESRLENVIWEKREIEERLHRAIKERKVIETVLKEIDAAHEKALSRIDWLESKLQALKEENLRLNEVQGKASWDYKARNDEIDNVRVGIPSSKHYGVPSWNTNYEGTVGTFQDVRTQRDSSGEVEKSKYQELSPFKPQQLFRDSVVDEILERRRVVALSRSLFSSILSLVVAMIVWEAEDPCVPLVAALFSVVGMSLNSVLRFFSTIKNKPAFDAVALLSVNWFILGTLTYPALPDVARMLAPRVIALGDRFVTWLGFSS